MNIRLVKLIAAAALVAPFMAQAQAIRITNEAFPLVEKPQSLPFAQPKAVTPAYTAPAPMTSTAPAAQPVGFSVTRQDKTIREVLSRWAAQAGWTHAPSHWTIDQDITVEGEAAADVFGGDFRKAVRILISSTELTDRPVQPCFYTNKIVRVVPIAAMCDRGQE